MSTPESGEISRRDALRRGLVGVGVAATAPVVVTSFTSAASAASGDAAPTAVCTQSMNNRTITGTAIAGADVYVYTGSDCSEATQIDATTAAPITGLYSVTFNVNSVGSTGPFYVNQDADNSGNRGVCSGAINC